MSSVERVPGPRVRRSGEALTEYAPCVRGLYFRGWREATRRLWGEAGLAAVSAELTPETRAVFERDTPPTEWVPVRHMIAINLAVWAACAGRERARYAPGVWLVTDLTVGVVRRTLLQVASPRTLLERVPRLWRDDNTHGEVEVDRLEARSAVLRLRDHPYVDLPQSRAAIAEMLRYIVTLTRASDVTETHAVDGEATMKMRFEWR